MVLASYIMSSLWRAKESTLYRRLPLIITHPMAIFDQFTVTACNQLLMVSLNTVNRGSVAGICTCGYCEGKSNVSEEAVNKLVADGERKVRRWSWEKHIGSLDGPLPTRSLNPFLSFSQDWGWGIEWVGSNADRHKYTKLLLLWKLLTNVSLWLTLSGASQSHFIRVCLQEICVCRIWMCAYSVLLFPNVEANWACVTVCLLTFERICMF